MKLSYLHTQKFSQINLNDPFFDSLKNDYIFAFYLVLW